MCIVCFGGGLVGFYFVILMKLWNSVYEIMVIECNCVDDIFGWGVVFFDEIFDNLVVNDLVSVEKIRVYFVYWDDIVFYVGCDK